jgi:hypothetical protein
MGGSAGERFSIRAICKEGWTSLQTLSAIAFVLRVSLVDANSPSHRRRIVCASQGDADDGHPAGTLLTPSRSLDFHPSSTYHNCSKCFFSASPHRPRPEGTVGHNPTMGVT